MGTSKYFVYILIDDTKRIYIGYTNNLERRIAEHNDPYYTKSSFTKRSKGKWVLLHSEEYATRSDAVVREKALKSGQGRQWIHEVLLKDSNDS